MKEHKILKNKKFKNMTFLKFWLVPQDAHSYSPPQRLEGNELPVFVDISGCVAAVSRH